MVARVLICSYIPECYTFYHLIVCEKKIHVEYYGSNFTHNYISAI